MTSQRVTGRSKERRKSKTHANDELLTELEGLRREGKEAVMIFITFFPISVLAVITLGIEGVYKLVGTVVTIALFHWLLKRPQKKGRT